MRSWLTQSLPTASIVRALHRTELDEHALQLRVVLDRGLSVLVADARFLHAAERHLDWRDIIVVDPADSGLEPVGDPMPAREIAREHTGRKPEPRRIGALYHLIRVREGEHRHDWTENLLTHDLHVVGAAGEDRGRHEIAPLERRLHEPFAAVDELCPLFLAGLDIGEHLLQVRTRDQSANLRLRRERRAHAQLLRAPDEEIEELIVNVAVHVDTR